MHPDIPISYVEAHAAPISVLLQLEVIADSHDRIQRRRDFLADHERAVAAAAARRRRGR